MIPSDRGGKKKIGGTFLGVPVSTLTPEAIKDKAAKDKAVADKRAPIVNNAIKEQNQALISNSYSNRAEKLWKDTGKLSNYNIVTIADIIKPLSKEQQANLLSGYSYDSSRNSSVYANQNTAFRNIGQNADALRNRLAQINPLQSGGQFTGVGQQAQEIMAEIKPKTMTDYAQNAALVSSNPKLAKSEFFQKYTLSGEEHDEIIAWGEDVMGDNTAVIDWILSAPSDYEMRRRLEVLDTYFGDVLDDVSVFDGDTNKVISASQFKSNAEFPPWLEDTAENRAKWEYYTVFSHDVVQTQVDAYKKMKADARARQQNPYESAFSSGHDSNAIDSFLDVIIASKGDTVDEYYESFINNASTYLNEYVFNPFKYGPKGALVAAGNALWNMMDTMDIASRGVRAFVAGDMVLGGSGGKEFKNANSSLDDYYTKTWEKYGLAPSEEYESNKNHGQFVRNNDAKFEGQKVYWVSLEGHTDEESQIAQKRFMDNGGYALLLKAHPEYASKANLSSEEMSLSEEALEAKLDAAFKNYDIDWHEIYADIDENYFVKDRTKRDLKQAFENVRETYSTPSASYNADTGNMVGDIVLETVLDPGLIAGGLSKVGIGNRIGSAAENAVKDGFSSVAKNSDELSGIMRSKEVRRALNEFIGQNEGKNIIFKKSKDLLDDINLLMDRITKNTGLLDNLTDRQAFRRAVYGDLMNKNISTNGKIIASTARSTRAFDEKALKAAYYMDKAIDGIDSAIVKSSFMLPWGGVKAAKLGYNMVMDTPVVKEALGRRMRRLSETAATMLDEKTGKINVLKISDVMNKHDAGVVYDREWKFALQNTIDQYHEVAFNTQKLITSFAKGDISAEDAIKAVSDNIAEITGGKFRTIDELAAYVNKLDPRYADSIGKAYSRISNTVDRLETIVNRRSEEAVGTFLEQVRSAETPQELKRLFREYSDNSYIMGLRQDVLNNTQFKIASEELDQLIYEVRTGVFTDIDLNEIDINKGIEGVRGVSKETVRRTVKFEQFTKALTDVGIDLDTDDKLYKKLGEFVDEWSKFKSTSYNISDVLDVIDRCERSIHFREILKVENLSETAALQSHQLVSQFNRLRRQIKRIDLLSLKRGDYVYTMHVDRMAMQMELRKSVDVQNAYQQIGDNVIDPLLKDMTKLTSEEMSLADSNLVQTVRALSEERYGFDRTNDFIDTISHMQGFTDEKLHTVLNGLANNFGYHGDLQDLLDNPDLFKHQIEITLRTQAGDSKVGMKAITDSLQAFSAGKPAKFLESYSDELADPVVKARLDKYINKATADPTAYVEKQMLYAALADPSLVKEWDALANKGQIPIGFHLNTTGLSTELNSVTSVSFRNWVPLNLEEWETLTLSKLLDAFESGQTVVFQRRMNTAELDEFSESVLRRMDMKGATKEQMLDEMARIYGVSASNPYKSEEEMLREVCDFLKQNSLVGDEIVSPSLIVHDLDGFNIPFFNNKVRALSGNKDATDPIANYVDNLSQGVERNQINTLSRLSDKVGDFAYTDDQIRQVIEELKYYADDMKLNGSSYRFMDTSSYTRKLENLATQIEHKTEIGTATDFEKRFLDAYESINGSVLVSRYNKAVYTIDQLTQKPRGYAFVLDGSTVNPTHAALQAAGRDTINVESRMYVDDVLSYFDMNIEDGFCVTVEDLEKMHKLSSYINLKRQREIVNGAEEYLAEYKEGFDRVILSMKQAAQSEVWEATELAYLADIKVPDNAIDSYLIAKKLYSDHIRFWLDQDIYTGIHKDGASLDTLKTKLEYARAKYKFGDPHVSVAFDDVANTASDYVNNYRRRFFDELIVGGFSDIDELQAVNTEETLHLLEGVDNPMIFKKAARSDYEKKILKYENGILKEGLDISRKSFQSGAEMASNLRQLKRIDSYMNRFGATRPDSILAAATHNKALQLFDLLHRSDIAKRSSFANFIEKVSNARQLQMQQHRINILRGVDGKFNRNALYQELLYNGFNMTVFNSHCYTTTEIRELTDFVKELQSGGDDFLSLYTDVTTGNVFIYLNDNAVISEANNMRYINQKHYFSRPDVRDHVPFAEFDELLALDDFKDIDDTEDFRSVYNHLLSCWDDTRMLSMGSINGTSGRTVSMKQAEEFIKTLPDALEDWCTSEGLLRNEIARGVIYDPGFVHSEPSNMLFDFMDTLHAQAAVAKEDTMLVNMIMNHNDNVTLNNLAEFFNDDELIAYFRENPDYVVCTVVADETTATGFQLRQLKLNNQTALDLAKSNPNTTILPYDAYYEFANTVNRNVTDNPARQILCKYMQAYKAFALVRPGTWMRNYIDATMKAGFDNGEGITGIASMIDYEHKAIKAIDTYYRIAKADPSLLKQGSWDMVQRVFKTDMTYDDFELLKGLVDSDRFYTADKMFINKTTKARGGHNIISGQDIGLRNLTPDDFEKAYTKYLANELDLPLNKKEFKDIYFHIVTPDETTKEAYEEMFRKFSNNLHNADATSIYDKTINNMFKPFGQVESVVRYAQTMYLRDMGLSDNQITKHIHATQFYTAPSYGTWSKLETIMPFITFKYNNAMYWVRMMDENPRYFRYFEDIYGNFAEETMESMEAEGQEIDYATDYGLQSGGIPLGSGKVYLSMDNSFLSAINNFYGIANNIDDINSLFKDAVRYSLYNLGFESTALFNGADLDPTDEDFKQKVINMVPGGSLVQKGYKTFKNIANDCTEEGGPTMETLYSTLNFLSVLGVRHIYKDDPSFDFNEWQEELALDGKWYDANLGRIVNLDQKNEFGANDPNNSFEDVQNYMLVHFGKLWDANQHKFVTYDEYQPGGYNDGFDFENDPEAWNKLCAYMKEQGKIYDYNQRAFVYRKDFIPGGLNNPNLTFNEKVALMEEKFPNLKWDANQGAFVEADKYIAGGLNDTSSFAEVMALRRALYGQEYNRDTGHFEDAGEPSIVLMRNYLGIDRYDDRYDNYYSKLAIPKLWLTDGELKINGEGLLVTEDGKYVITGNAEYDSKVFDKVINSYGSGYANNRGYSGFKNYSYSKGYNQTYTNKQGKRSGNNTAYLSLYTLRSYSNIQQFYQFQFKYNYQYRNPQPRTRVRRLSTPRINYPYGGGYNKFSFYTR